MVGSETTDSPERGTATPWWAWWREAVAQRTVPVMTRIAPPDAPDAPGAAGDVETADTLAALATAAAALTVPVLTVCREGVVRSANGAAGRFFARDPEVVVGRHLMELVPEEDRTPLAGAHDAGGSLLGWVVTLADASAIEHAAAQLTSADDRQVAVLQRLPTPVMVSVDDVIVFANAAAHDLMGVEDLDRLSSRIAGMAHVDAIDHARITNRLTAADRGEQLGPATYRIVRPDRTTRLVEWTTIPMELGGRAALLYALIDQTELLEARDTVASSEAHQREIVDSLAEGVLVVDASGWCTDANQAAADLLHLPSVELLIGTRLDAMRLVVADRSPLPPNHHPLSRALEHGESVRAEVHRVLLGDEMRSLRVSVHPVLTFGQEAPTSAVLTFTDVTDELANVEAVAASEARFRNLAAFAPVAIFEAEPDGRWRYANHRWTEFTGRTVDDLGIDGWLETVHPDDRAEVSEAWRAALAESLAFTREVRHRRPDGRIVPVQMEVTPVRDDDGTTVAWLGTATDLSVQFALRRELEAREVRFRQLAERSPDVIMRIAVDPFRFDYISPAITPVLGVQPDDLYAEPLRFVRAIHPDDAGTVLGDVLSGRPREVLQFRVVHADGTVRTVEVRSHLVHDEDGRAIALEATARDITAAADLHRHLDTLAHRDTLTGLLNRRALTTALDDRFQQGVPTSVLFCDLDGFKAVNDTCGHEAGDAVLQEVAGRMSAAVRDGDLVARLAGDEFVIVTRPEGAGHIANRLLARLVEPIRLADGSTATVGTSIGIADLHDPATSDVTVDDLLKQADTAMYTAKRSGKGRVVRV
jgi:diguanylate cyclase (GGDEF)-like protein/PAS domain S-box-containing protein